MHRHKQYCNPDDQLLEYGCLLDAMLRTGESMDCDVDTSVIGVIRSTVTKLLSLPPSPVVLLVRSIVLPVPDDDSVLLALVVNRVVVEKRDISLMGGSMPKPQ